MFIIDKNERTTEVENFYNNVHFHPTDAIEDDWGRKVLDSMAKDGVGEYIRIYTMFEDMVTEKDGELIFDFSDVDKRIDYLISRNFKLLICYNFMPVCIAKDKELIADMKRYKNKTFNFSEPSDYKLWEKVCFEFTKHITDKYKEKTNDWYTHCWNEPDHWYWLNNERADKCDRNKVEGYVKLYEAFYKGVKKANPKIKTGGPSAAWNTEFIENVVKKIGDKLDFVSLHTYANGVSGLKKGELPDVEKIINKIENIYEITEKSGFPAKEMIIDEWSVSAGGFRSIEECDKVYIRDNEYFSAFYFEAVKKINDFVTKNNIPLKRMLVCLSGQHDLEYDFDGRCNFFTLSGYKKPIYNAYKLASMLGNKWYKTDNGIIATKKEDKIVAVIYNYVQDFSKESEKEVTVKFENVSSKKGRMYIIDKNHSNSYTKYLELNKPEFSEEVMAAGELYSKEFETADGKITLNLKTNSVVLMEIC